MKVKTVMKKFHKLVPFPISSEKIRTAGYNVEQYVTDLIQELRLCSDLPEDLSSLLRSVIS
jgi:hypothetical protein